MPKSAEQAKADRLDTLAGQGMQKIDISDFGPDGEADVKETEAEVMDGKGTGWKERIAACKNMAELISIVGEIPKTDLSQEEKTALLRQCTEKSHEWPEQ